MWQCARCNKQYETAEEPAFTRIRTNLETLEETPVHLCDSCGRAGYILDGTKVKHIDNLRSSGKAGRARTHQMGNYYRKKS